MYYKGQVLNLYFIKFFINLIILKTVKHCYVSTQDL